MLTEVLLRGLLITSEEMDTACPALSFSREYEDREGSNGKGPWGQKGRVGLHRFWSRR
jgi:hypothetical protein